MSNKSSLKPHNLCKITNVSTEEVWMQVRDHAQEIADSEPQLTALLYDVVLNRACLGEAFAARLVLEEAGEVLEQVELVSKYYVMESPELILFSSTVGSFCCL